MMKSRHVMSFSDVGLKRGKTIAPLNTVEIVRKSKSSQMGLKTKRHHHRRLVCANKFSNKLLAHIRKESLQAPKTQTSQQAAPKKLKFKSSNETKSNFQNEKQVYNCNQCNEIFDCKIMLEGHQHEHLLPTIYHSPSFPTDYSFGFRLVSSYLCAFCQENFNCKESLLSHVERHIVDHEHACEMCHSKLLKAELLCAIFKDSNEYAQKGY